MCSEATQEMEAKVTQVTREVGMGSKDSSHGKIRLGGQNKFLLRQGHMKRDQDTLNMCCRPGKF